MRIHVGVLEMLDKTSACEMGGSGTLEDAHYVREVRITRLTLSMGIPQLNV